MTLQDSIHVPHERKAEREYEKSGCYPKQGRPFRLWALLGGLTLVVGLLALVSVLLNFLLI